MRVVLLMVAAAAPMAMAFAPSSVLPSCRTATTSHAAAAPSARLPRAAVSIRPLELRMTETASAAAGGVKLEGFKSDLMTQLSVGSGLKGAADPANRAEINEMVLKLESMNPTEDPALSSQLNGVWELLYTGGYLSTRTHLHGRDVSCQCMLFV